MLFYSGYMQISMRLNFNKQQNNVPVRTYHYVYDLKI